MVVFLERDLKWHYWKVHTTQEKPGKLIFLRKSGENLENLRDFCNNIS